MSERFTFDVGEHGATSAFVYRAGEPQAGTGTTLVLAHGAGASQTHPFLVDIAGRIALRGIDVVTFNFLYTERGRKMPDRPELLEACWLAALSSVRARSGLPNSRMFGGGKSMGGRIASNLAAAPSGRQLSLSGLVFLGYPLHPIGKPRNRRDEHLPRIPFPMLFVQGSRDELGSAAEVRALVRRLPGAVLHVVNGADHSFALLKREGADAQESALVGVADAVAAFLRSPRGPRAPRAPQPATPRRKRQSGP